MTLTTEAIFENGVFTPTKPLQLAEHQRVRITVEEIESKAGSNSVSPASSDREAALARFRASIDRLGFCSTVPYPKREELYDRKLPE